MNKYPTTEDYIGDLSDLKHDWNQTDSRRFYSYIILSFFAGVVFGVVFI